MRGFLAFTLSLLLIASIFTITGCAKKTIQTEDGKVEVESGLGGDKVTVTTEGGKGEFGVGVKLPANWPKDVPVYAGATPYGNISSIGEEGAEVIVAVFMTSDSLSALKAYYEKELPANGWKLEGTFNTATEEGTVYMMTVSKNQRYGSVTLSETEEGNSIAISIGTE